MSSLAALQGCGDDEEDTGGGGKGGTSGNAGEAGDGGTTTGGSTTGGRGGSSGSGATGGTAGATGGTGTGGSVSGAGGAPGGAGGAGGEGGAGGPQTRGELCVEYCTAYFANMCQTYATDSYNDDQPTCEVVCLNSAWEIGETGETGDTIWCRIDHANNAAAAATRELHCGHASQTPTGVCI